MAFLRIRNKRQEANYRKGREKDGGHKVVERKGMRVKPKRNVE